MNPLTQSLQRRLQQRSVLYLMGPGRMLDRVRQVPALLARLPRTAWDVLRKGQLSRGGGAADLPPDLAQGKLDFRAAVIDQFVIVQSRIDDAVRSNPLISQRIDDAYESAKIDPGAPASSRTKRSPRCRNGWNNAGTARRAIPPSSKS